MCADTNPASESESSSNDSLDPSVSTNQTEADQTGADQTGADQTGADQVDGESTSAQRIKIGSQRNPVPVEEAPKATEDLTQEELDEQLAEAFPGSPIDRVSDELQAEIDAAIGDISLDDLMDDAKQPPGSIEFDKRYQGTVVKVHRDSVFVSLGGQAEGVASIKQFEEELPEVGSELTVVVTGMTDGMYDLLVPGASVAVADWSDLTEGIVVEVKITGHNKGGLECEINGIRGFIPAGQISLYRVEDFDQFVDEKLRCVVTEANPQRRNLVLSHRAVMEREKEAAREKLMGELEVGQTREGVVRSLRDFGAFVDLGGVDGLIHISQLSWDRVTHPRDVLSEGETVKVRIEKIDEQTGKIGLSYRDQANHPWKDVEASFQVGSVVAGTVSRVMDFGAFVKLAPGVEGLVHISELAHHRVKRPDLVVKEDQQVDVKILDVDKDNQRMSLSIKQALAAPATSDAEDEQADTPLRPMAVAKHTGPLKGGTNRKSGGEDIGLNL